MTLAELETIARLRLPITVVVFDDADLRQLTQNLRAGPAGLEKREQTVRVVRGDHRLNRTDELVGVDLLIRRVHQPHSSRQKWADSSYS